MADKPWRETHNEEIAVILKYLHKANDALHQAQALITTELEGQRSARLDTAITLVEDQIRKEREQLS